MPLNLALRAVRALPVKGASAVTRSRAGVLIVEDDLGIYRLRGSVATLWAGPDLHPALADLEGITANEAGDIVWALSEEHGTLVELRLGARGPRVARTAVLERPGTTKNKGFEGLAWLAPRFSPSGRASLVAVHEHKPRRVCLCDLRTLVVTDDLRLPREAKAALDDLADVAVDPVSGLILLLSEESRRIAVMQLDHDGLRLVQCHDLPLEDGERPEGLAFLSASRLAVVTDGPARLLTFRVTRRAAARV
jgi:uncharacterized protein YjiK